MGLPELKVTDVRVTKPSKQRYAYAVSSLAAGSKVGFHNSSYKNVVRALEERVFRVKQGDEFVRPPQPLRNALKMHEFHKRYTSAVGSCRVHSIEEVVNCYSSGKKRIYQKAANTLLTNPVSARDARVTAFVKVEKVDLSIKTDPCPRLIQPRSKRYNLVLGQYLRLNEKHLTRSIDRVFGETTVLSGYDSQQTGYLIHQKWKKYANPVAIGLDASRFDQHTSVPALKFEHSVWNTIFRCPLLAKLLSYQLYNKGIAYCDEGKAVRYSTNGCRMSGDINTSLGNKLIMCAMVWSYLENYGIRASLCNNGDDCVLICDKDQVELIQKTLFGYFYDKGYNMEVEEPVDCMEKIEFCRSQPVAVGNSYHMVRGVSSLTRDTVSMQSVSNLSDRDDMLSAVGYCGMVINDGIPVHSRLHAAMFRLGGSKVNLMILDKYEEYNHRERMGKKKTVNSAISDASRISYYKAFGIDPHRQKLIEEYYNQSSICARIDDVKELPLLYSSLHPNLFKRL
jgi:hypothetical protein